MKTIEKQAAEAEELVTVMTTPMDTRTIEQCGLCDGSGEKTTPAALHQLVPHAMTMRCARCWGRGTVPAGFLPADVILRVPPLTDTMGRTVIECAAGLLVAALALRGNEWRPVLWSDVREVMMAAKDAGEPQSTEDTAARFVWDIGRNPFLRPNFSELVSRGFATRDETTEAIAFTTEGIAALAKWVHLPRQVESSVAALAAVDAGAVLSAPEWTPELEARCLAAARAARTEPETVVSENPAEGECSSCGEESCKPNECPNSRRPCGHHCNCSWSQEVCCWCGKEFGEDDV